MVCWTIPCYIVAVPVSPIQTTHISASFTVIVLHLPQSNIVLFSSPELFSLVHWALCVYWTPFIFSPPRSSFQSKGKSIALIHSGQPSYPSFLSSRIALFFTLQLTLLRPTCQSVLPSRSPPSSSFGHPTFFPAGQQYLAHHWSK